MREVTLVFVGKLKDTHLEALEGKYLKRLTSPKLKIVEVKASSEDRDAEGEAVLARIDELARGSSINIVLLSEWGKTYTSTDFAKWWYSLLEGQSPVYLVIGGAEGHGEKIKARARAQLSLSPMTYAHKLARLVLVEQLYRAQCIHAGHPYHK